MIITLPSLVVKLDHFRPSDQIIVLVTGVFDLLHQEHIKFLTKAKAVGDLLVVGLETDARVKTIKGHARPINSQATRLHNLDHLNIADYVFLLPQQFSTQSNWEQFIAILKPDIYAVSSHTKHLKNKRRIMKHYGGQLKIVHPHNPQISTSRLLSG